MEFCNGGCLQDFIKKYRPTENQVVYYFREIIEAFRYLREKDFIHRDIKPENILINNGVLKLADFGFAKEVLQNGQVETIAGTQLYMAPQIIHGHKYTDKCDIWSLGVLLFFMLYYNPDDMTKSYPFYEKNLY